MGVNDALIRTIKTIASGFIEKAGFNRTRTGQIVGVNSITNTYSVRVDGQIYPNVPVEGNGTFVVGDVAKVHIPNNQPSQMYMTAWGNSVDLTNIVCDTVKVNQSADITGTLNVNDIGYDITQAEYDELISLLGGGQ